MRHRLEWFIHRRAHSLRKGDEHPAYTHHGVWHTLPYIFYWLPIHPYTFFTYPADKETDKINDGENSAPAKSNSRPVGRGALGAYAPPPK